ncbi:PLP-dependent transferase, partial [Rhizobium ruizarguesonis]
ALAVNMLGGGIDDDMGAELQRLLEKAITPKTKVFFLESPTNQTLEVIDIAGVAKLANQIGAKVVVDNVFATTLFQKPLE